MNEVEREEKKVFTPTDLSAIEDPEKHYVITISHGISHTGYSYWNQEMQIGALSIEDATIYSELDNAQFDADNMFDARTKEDLEFVENVFKIVTLKEAMERWDKFLGLGGTHYNVYRTGDIGKYMSSPNQVMVGIEGEGTIFCYFDTTIERRNEIVKDFEVDYEELVTYKNAVHAIKAVMNLDIPSEVSDAHVLNTYRESLALIVSALKSHSTELLEPMFAENVLDRDTMELDIINVDRNVLIKLARYYGESNAHYVPRIIKENHIAINEAFVELMNAHSLEYKKYKVPLLELMNFTIFGDVITNNIIEVIIGMYNIDINPRFVWITDYNFRKLMDVVYSSQCVNFKGGQIPPIEPSVFQQWYRAPGALGDESIYREPVKKK